MKDWKYMPFDSVVRSRGAGARGLPQSEWLESGPFPVIGQGSSYIEGWTDRDDLVLSPGNGMVLYGGHTRRTKFVATPFVPGPNVKLLEPDASVNAKFLFHFLRYAEVESKGYADHFPEVRRLEVPVPPLEEQRRIAAILDKADALRTKRREALAHLDRLAQSIFVEMFGTYEKGQIRWTTIPLAELASDMKIGLVRSSEEFGDDFGVPYVRMNAVGRSGEFLRALVQKTDVTEEELEEYCLQPGDILFNTRNSKELVGKTAIFRETGEYVYNNNLMRLRFHGQVDAEYMAQCFLTPFMRQELEFRKAGTTSVFAIYARDLSTVPIPVPPIELQREFAKRRQALYRTSLKIAAQEQETTRLFTALQHRAFQGEL